MYVFTVIFRYIYTLWEEKIGLLISWLFNYLKLKKSYTISAIIV